MPLLHRETSRGGGGSQESRRSLAEILDTAHFAGDAAAPKPDFANGSSSAWRWEPPGSPEPAQSPRALVPAACFPPRDHPTASGSFSELAVPGSWAKESSEGIVDLVESFKSLAAPPQVLRRNASAKKRGSSIQTRLSCEFTLESWPSEGTSAQAQEDCHAVARRASFCGTADPEHRLLTWRGVLPLRCVDANPPGGFSPKVFMGGLPWDISEEALTFALREFQPTRVEWPGSDAAPRGFAYVTLESERRVRALLHASRRDAGKWIYRVTSRNMRTKDVEVIPWAVADSNWVCPAGGAGGGGGGGSLRLEPTRTVFVGALHGVMSAAALATIMSDLFSGVVYAGIDTDKYKYPIGSGRVTFNNVRSYVRAICAAYVEIRTDKFTKKIQVDPYLEDAMCSVCNLQQGPYFCREPVCFTYFCRSCWVWQHPFENHRALMRNSKSGMVNMCNVTNAIASNGHGYSNGNGSYGNGNGSYSNGNGSYSNGNGSYSNGNGSYSNGNGSYINGNSSCSNGNGSYSNGNGSYSNGNGSYSNGNGSYSNGNGSYSNGNGSYSNGNDYSNRNGSYSNRNGSNGSSIGQRQSASELGSLYNGSFTHAHATPSPSTSGGSADCGGDEQSALGWSSLEP